MLLAPASAALADRVLDAKMHHLRSGPAREWDEFPADAEGSELVLRFDARANTAGESTLRLRHRDLKQNWVVALNANPIARLPLDENEMLTCWPVPAGALHDGPNELRIACTTRGSAATSDDVLVGQIELLDAPRAKVLGEASIDVTVLDAGRDAAIPCRITIADERGALVDVGNVTDGRTAVRPGVVYTPNGRARLALAAGRYTLYAGRGFAYSLDRATLDLHSGDALRQTFRIHRVVPLDGYVSCDTHVHTFTYSRHGDCTLAERMLTLAGEDVQLPIATDHNLQIDYEAAARAAGVRQFFTPVIGNEVTTASLGHFNVLPIPRSARLLNWRAPTWASLSRNIAETVPGDPAIILNHARDTHGNFRPFDPARHLSLLGEDLDGWPLPANAMEILNSGATQTDPMQLARDWFGMLNAGHFLTPVGASDSHDVSRYIVGQARTYIRCDNTDPSKIDVAQAARNFREGRVLVSYGLAADLTVSGKYHPGDLAPAPDGEGDLEATVRVLGPEWTSATHVTLFANGSPLREADIHNSPEPAGVKFQVTWKIPHPRHDVWLVALATGPGVNAPYWPTAKPYQPTSPTFRGVTLAATAPIRIDADSSGQFDSPRDYAARLVDAAHADIAAAINALAAGAYDSITASHAARLLHLRHPTDFEATARAALATAPPEIRRGFEDYRAALAASDSAREAKAATHR